MMILTPHLRSIAREDLTSPEAVHRFLHALLIPRVPRKPPRKRPRKPARRPLSDVEDTPFPEVLDALAGMPATMPDSTELLAALEALGTPRDRTALIAILCKMERHGLIETWPDQDRLGEIRVMLTTISIRRLGLELAPRGKGWRSAG